MTTLKHPRPDWYAYVRPGDVLRAPSGSLRVVRSVKRKEGGRLHSICFVKLRKSQYRSPVAIYFGSELWRYQYLGARLRLDSPLDKRVACTIDWTEPALCDRVTQDDVVGVIA